jgi:hypothetical protein
MHPITMDKRYHCVIGLSFWGPKFDSSVMIQEFSTLFPVNV